MKQIYPQSLTDRMAKRTIAMTLLSMLSVTVFSPLLVFAIPTPADAFCGAGGCTPDLAGGSDLDEGFDDGNAGSGRGLGGLLGNLLQNPMIMQLLMMLLMQQLFQGFGQQGGATPQTGSVDEQAPQYANVNRPNQRQASNTYGGGSQPSASPSPSSFSANQSLYLVENTITPTSAKITKGQKIIVYNTEEDQRIVTVRKQGQTTGQSQTFASADSRIFPFPLTGTFKVCTKKASTAEVCPTTVTVKP